MEKIASFTVNHLCLMPGVYVSRKDTAGQEVLPIVTAAFEFIRDFEGEVPGAAARDCGNYLDMNLPMAKYLAKQYLDRALYCAGPENLNYPE